jgi:hypothetical protein
MVMAKRSRKPGKKLTLKKKALKDLPPGEKSKSAKGGLGLTLTQRTFAPPYIPVSPVLRPPIIDTDLKF